ncbi:MAG: ABC transporter permease [Candidatus Woesearchaeota archaeon]
MIQDYFRIALKSLSRRKLRSWLTLIGIFIGIAAVISLVSLGQGMEEAIYQEFEDIGSDKLFIEPSSLFGSMGEGAGAEQLRKEDYDFIKRLSGIDSTTSYVMTSAHISYRDEVRYYSIAGIPTDSKSLDLTQDGFTEDIWKGRDLEQGDGKTVVAGYHHATRGLYDRENLQLNSNVHINGEKFHVAGFYNPIGSSVDDRMLVMPEDTFREITGIKNRVDMIIVKVNTGEDPLAVAENIKKELARYRGEDVEDATFQVETPEDLLDNFQTILDVVRAVLIGIAGISLFVGGVGIMNTMYTSVLERNKEIGIMKAIGARNSDIFTLFAIESGFLGVAGGVIGIILGSGLAKAVEEISRAALGKTFLQAHFSWELFLGAMLFSFLVGMLAGTLPALQAAKLQPADTLRDE